MKQATRKTPIFPPTGGNRNPQPGPGVQKVQDLRELPVPQTILRELPEARWWFEVIFAMTESQLPLLQDALKRAGRRDHVAFARAFVNLYKLKKELDTFYSAFEKLWAEYNGKLIPEAIEGAGVTNVPLAEGLRVQRAEVCRASIRADMRDKAYAYLRKHYPEVVSETVNASTLSALANKLLTEDNVELPTDIFNVHWMPVMSVVKSSTAPVRPGKNRE